MAKFDDYWRNRHLIRLIATPILLLLGLVGLSLYHKGQGCVAVAKSPCTKLLTEEEATRLTGVSVDQVTVSDYEGCSADYQGALGQRALLVTIGPASGMDHYRREAIATETWDEMKERPTLLDVDPVKIVSFPRVGGEVAVFFYPRSYAKAPSNADLKAVVPLVGPRLGWADQFLQKPAVKP